MCVLVVWCVCVSGVCVSGVCVSVPWCVCYRRQDGGASLLQRLQRLGALLRVEDQSVCVLLQGVAPRARAGQPAELGQTLVHPAAGLTSSR